MSLNQEENCYCDPTIPSIGCNRVGCLSIAIVFLILFLVPFGVCVYRIGYSFKTKAKNNWSLISHIFIMVTCFCRIVRSALQIKENDNAVLMALLYIVPICLLIASYLNTLYVWIKIIYHINFSKIVARIFPAMGWFLICYQVVLFVLFLIGCIVYWAPIATNIVFLIYLVSGA
ncbi:hypothetical protein SAMD00019534_023680, partial [Acytostelium subglobosum LB1]|uniref:hypothetical protein n=1 Tax=Acytostelium subglobosum LB1 TaxID=1410327 RepID=UPI000644D000